MEKIIISDKTEDEVIYITLDPNKHPIAFKKRFDSFIANGFTKEDAMEHTSAPIELCVFIDHNGDPILLDPGVIESGKVFHPYAGYRILQPENILGKMIDNTYHFQNYKFRNNTDEDGDKFIEVIDDNNEVIDNIYGTNIPDMNDFEEVLEFEMFLNTFLKGNTLI